MQIAIDGPAGAGKSTIAKALSKKLGFMYVDTGAMYRTIALACIETGTDTDDEEAVSKVCADADIDIRYEDGIQHMFLDGRDVSSEIRREQVGNGASAVSRFGAVRERLVAMQKELGSRYDVVMDGRDIGTKVLPEAELKIYLTASARCRAMRRYLELKERGEDPVLEDIRRDIETRDHNDMTRAVSPLIQAEDSILVDTSEMTIDEVISHITGLFENIR